MSTNDNARSIRRELFDLVELAVTKDIDDIRLAKETDNNEMIQWVVQFVDVKESDVLNAYVTFTRDNELTVKINDKEKDLNDLWDVLRNHPSSAYDVVIPYKDVYEILKSGAAHGWDMNYHRKSEYGRKLSDEYGHGYLTMINAIAHDPSLSDITDHIPNRTLMIYPDGFIQGYEGDDNVGQHSVFSDIESLVPHARMLSTR